MAGGTHFDSFISKLIFQLEKDLPGQKAQMKMAPLHRFDFFESKEEAKLSSVLILLYPKGNSINIVLIKRASYNGHHSGQISFPGGKFEENDATLIHTALRETEEEIGVEKSSISVLGDMSSLYIPVSNIMVLPVVAYVKSKPDFFVENDEVDEIVEVSLEYLLNPGIIKSGEIRLHEREIKFPYYDVNNHQVWGATAMMISEFLEIVKSVDE